MNWNEVPALEEQVEQTEQKNTQSKVIRRTSRRPVKTATLLHQPVIRPFNFAGAFTMTGVYTLLFAKIIASGRKISCKSVVPQIVLLIALISPLI